MRRKLKIIIPLVILLIGANISYILFLNDSKAIKKINLPMEKGKIELPTKIKSFHNQIEPENQIMSESLLQALDFDPISTTSNIAEGYALVCGVSNYPGTSSDLDYCDDDARDLANLMQTEFKIPEQNIITLQNSQVTRSGITQAVNEISQVMDANDMFFFSYSGHGSADVSKSTHSWSISSSHPYSNYEDHYWHYSSSGAAMMRVHFTSINVESDYDYIFVGENNDRAYYWDYFTGSHSNVWSAWVLTDDIYVNLYSDFSNVAWGFQVDKIEIGYWVAPYTINPYDCLGTGMTGSELDTILDVVPGVSVVFLDSCFSGGVGEDLQAPNRYILTASGEKEYSLEDSSNRNGVFTYQFLNIWNPSYDANYDNSISFPEVFDHLYSRTVSRSSSLGYTHHPQEFDPGLGEITFRPNVNINILQINQTTIQVDYTARGLGEGKLSFACYDVDSQIYTLQSESVNYSNSDTPQSLIFYISANDDAINAIGRSDYHLYHQISSDSLEFLQDSFNSSSDIDNDGLSDLAEFCNNTNPWSNDTDGDGMGDGFEVFNNLNPFFDDGAQDLDWDTLTNFEEYSLGLDPQNPDCDSDGCLDGWEVYYGLNASNFSDCEEDMDGDQLSNLLEFQNNGDPTSNDTDNDNLTDYQEYYLGTSLNNTDSDDNGISDADDDEDNDSLGNLQEFQIGTDPLLWDTDDDGCSDGWEIIYNLDPLDNLDGSYDLDNDGLSNLLEYQNNGDPTSNDTDNDNLTDYQEYYLGTSLNNTDSDDNGISDADDDEDNDSLGNLQEFQIGTDPLLWDTDDDGCSDGWEITYGLDPLSAVDSMGDLDNDGLSNLLEYQNYGDPSLNDTDDDQLSDFQEFYLGTDLNNADSDDNGISDADDDEDNDSLGNLQEFQIGTDPLNPDSDGDTLDDGWEIMYGLNPLNAGDSMGDLDNDGLNNFEEYRNNGNPTLSDSDGDGLNDYDEFILGTQLSNPDSDSDGFNDNFEHIMQNDPLNEKSNPIIHFISFFLIILGFSTVFVFKFIRWDYKGHPLKIKEKNLATKEIVINRSIPNFYGNQVRSIPTQPVRRERLLTNEEKMVLLGLIQLQMEMENKAQKSNIGNKREEPYVGPKKDESHKVFSVCPNCHRSTLEAICPYCGYNFENGGN